MLEVDGHDRNRSRADHLCEEKLSGADGGKVVQRLALQELRVRGEKQTHSRTAYAFLTPILEWGNLYMNSCRRKIRLF